MLRRVLPRIADRMPTGAPGTIDRVPTISRFFGLTVAMYFDDHGHPHLHVRHAEGAAKIRIDVVEVIDSSLPTDSYGSRWPGPSFTSSSCWRTGGGPGRVRH